jgi:small subunit ribosomal protein S9
MSPDNDPPLSDEEPTPGAQEGPEEAVEAEGSGGAVDAGSLSEESAASEEQPEPVAAETEPVAASGESEPVAPEAEPVAEEPEPVAEETGPVAEEQPEPVAEEPAEPVAASGEEELVAPAPEPVAEEPEPVAEEPEPVAEQPEPVAEQPEPVAEQPEPEPTPEQPERAPAQEAQPVADAGAPEPVIEELPEVPRERPEIPGADLIPDLVTEQEEFLDAEARAAAEAEAEARAAREREEVEEELRSEPIADAAIDLAAGARYSATGKRKSAVARVILKPGSGNYAINGKALETYFPRETLQRVIRQPLETVGYDSRMDVVARMHGGGTSAQAGALRHGISRALIVADPHLRGELKRRGFLTRDPRVKERKKAGLKKARKRPQFSKR